LSETVGTVYQLQQPDALSYALHDIFLAGERCKPWLLKFLASLALGKCLLSIHFAPPKQLWLPPLVQTISRLSPQVRDFQRIKYSKKNKRQHIFNNDNHYEGEKGVADGNPFLPLN
jgi:hypothetical protein